MREKKVFVMKFYFRKIIYILYSGVSLSLRSKGSKVEVESTLELFIGEVGP